MKPQKSDHTGNYTGTDPSARQEEPKEGACKNAEPTVCPPHFLTNLGLCAKAGKLIFGADLICEELRSGGKKRPVLVLVAGDCAANNQKRLLDRCAYYKTDCLVLALDGAQMAHAVGKSAKLAAVALTDAQMRRLLKL